MKAKTLTLLLYTILFGTLTAPLSAQIITYQKTFGGAGFDIGNCLQPTADSGFIIDGQTKSFGDTSGDTYLIKVDKYGNAQMEKTFGGAWLDGGNTIATTGDGFFLTDHTTSFGAGECDSYVFKVDLDGNMKWNHTFGFARNDAGYMGIQTMSGDYIITGLSEPPSDTNGVPFVARYGTDGTPLWSQLYSSGMGYRIVQTPDSNFVIVGITTAGTNGPDDMLVFKVNATGDIIWRKTVGGSGYDDPYSIINTADGNLLIAGYTSSYGANWNACLVKLTPDGDTIWEHTYGTPGCRAYGVVETSDGYVFAGQLETDSGDLDIMVVKTDLQGNQIWLRSYGGPKDDYMRWIAPCADGGFGIVGTTQSYGAGGNDLYLLKIDANGEIPTAITEVAESDVQVEVYPNPAHGSFTVKTTNVQSNAVLNLMDVTGNIVRPNLTLAGSSNTFNTDNLSAGYTFIRLPM